MTLIVLGY